MESIRVKKLHPNAILPTYGSAEAAGADLYACLDQEVHIKPGQTVFIPTGLSMELPKGYAGLIFARSGLACKRGLAPANKVGVVDSDYRGEICVVRRSTYPTERTHISFPLCCRRSRRCRRQRRPLRRRTRQNEDKKGKPTEFG